MVAYLDAGDPSHVACRELLENHHGPLLVPTLVVTEVAYLTQRAAAPHAEVGFLRDLTTGDLELQPLEGLDLPRIAELMWTYRDLPLGTVDASVVALAERLKVGQIATLDRKHFSVVRPLHVEAFELLP